jgi:hypothetical protein
MFNDQVVAALIPSSNWLSWTTCRSLRRLPRAQKKHVQCSEKRNDARADAQQRRSHACPLLLHNDCSTHHVDKISENQGWLKGERADSAASLLWPLLLLLLLLLQLGPHHALHVCRIPFHVEEGCDLMLYAH